MLHMCLCYLSHIGFNVVMNGKNLIAGHDRQVSEHSVLQLDDPEAV